MKKRLSMIAFVLVLIFGLTACGKQKGLNYDAVSLEGRAEVLLRIFSGTQVEQLLGFKEESELRKASTMEQLGAQAPDGSMVLIEADAKDFETMIDAWVAANDELGAYMGHEEFKIEESSKMVTLKADAHFEKRDGKILIQFDKNMKMKTLTVDGVYTTGEIMGKAGLNTLMGMGTVFVVLIFISFVISLLKYISKLQEALKKKPKEEAPVMMEEQEDAEEELSSDEELVTVIAAAIATYEQKNTDDFVVRSIRRKKSNRWNG